tara:strand:- start:262 stop:474 length:213 start_codon:yes stop_codon:yes gene_type:complete
MINMQKIINKLNNLSQILLDLPEIIYKQNRDIEDMSQELLGKKMSEDITNKVVEQQLVEEVNRRLKEAFQ